MGTSTLQLDQHNIVHQIDPITKILFVVVSISVSYILSSLMVSSIAILVCIAILLIGRVFKKLIPIIGVSLLVMISIFLIQGLFYGENSEVLFAIGLVVFYKEGLLYALDLCLKIIVIICSFSVLILTTTNSLLVESLMHTGLSPKIGYVVLSVLQLIPQMSASMTTISDAQKSRGMVTEGKLTTRIKAFFPLIGPVILSSLLNTRERSIALEVRGFDSSHERTYLNKKREYPFNRLIRMILFITLVLAIIGRIVL